MSQTASSCFQTNPRFGTSVRAPLGVNPNGLTSLKDMYILIASQLVHVGRMLQALQDQSSLGIAPGEFVSPENRKYLIAGIAAIRSTCETAGLPTSTGLLAWLQDEVGRTELTYSAVHASLNQASAVFQQELHRLLFFYVEPSRAKYHRTDLEQFLADPPFSMRALLAFPSAGRDAWLAGNSLACGFFDSSAFHCMRVFEKGLHALAERFQEPFAHENWGRIIDRIESKIRAIDNRFSEPPKDDRQRYAEIALEFRFVKDAWRNHISHGRSEYDFSRAEIIFAHTSSFMQRLAEAGIKE